MTVINPPYAIQARADHPASAFRKMLQALRGVQGVSATGDMSVTQNGTPNMSVNVAAGKAVIDGTENAQSQGSYLVHNDATVNLVIAAADPTNPRNDLVLAKVQDTQYSGATDAWSLVVVTGTPAGSPVDPATPANGLVLARVVVPALAASIVNANITNLAPAGVILNSVASAILPPGTAAVAGTSLLGARADHVHRGVAKLNEVVLGAPAASIVFSSIPATYQHLQILYSVRSDNAVNNNDLYLRLNGDAGANYDNERQLTSGTGVTATEYLAQTQMVLGFSPGTTATALYFSRGRIDLPNYTSAVMDKVALHQGTLKIGNATTQTYVVVSTGTWRTTNAAITSLTLLGGAGNLVAGSVASLYGY